MLTERIIIILIKRHGAVENREGVGNGGSLIVSLQRLGSVVNQGQRNLNYEQVKSEVHYMETSKEATTPVGNYRYTLLL